MKHLRFLVAPLLVAALVAFAACERDDDTSALNEQPVTPPTPPVLQLEGTSWRVVVDNDFYYYGMAFHVLYYSFLDFLDDEHGEQFTDLTVSYPPIFQSPDEQQSFTTVFTYTTSPNGGTMHVVEDAGGEHIEYDTPFEYDTASGTIRVMVNNSEMEEMLGTKVMVYEKIRP